MQREGARLAGGSETGTRHQVRADRDSNRITGSTVTGTDRSEVLTAATRSRRRWAYARIHRCPTPPPYGSSEWLVLEDDDPGKVAAVMVAAECWAQSGDTLELDLRREVEAARLAHKQAEDDDYQARAEAHRKEHVASRGGFAERRQAQLAGVLPQPGDHPGGPVPWIPAPRTETPEDRLAAICSGELTWAELFDAGEPELTCDHCFISLVVDPGGCGDGCEAGNLPGVK